MSKKKKILFTIGSPNQTTQMHQIAQELSEYDCWFSQFFADSSVVNWGIRQGWLDHTILAGHWKKRADAYLAKHGLQSDYKGLKNDYDLVVICSDLIVPSKVKNTKSIWVQEGMIDEVTWLTKLVKTLGLPRYLSVGTSLNGSSNLCDIYCVASEGYKQFFTHMGTDAGKILVTGMPNFDNIEQFNDNHFPFHNYVMVATSDIRECFRYEDRPAFIRQCVEIANGRPLLFKLHPNEIYDRAVQEIRENAPADTLIFQEGNTNEMIANCQELITQYSTVVYVGIALGKKVHSFFDVDELHRLAPIQNGGTSAQNIANVCRAYLEFDGTSEAFLQQFEYKPVSPEYA
ncbi:MAG: hypothetical protein U0Y10_12170 [Spirosomataceae bacterium]